MIVPAQPGWRVCFWSREQDAEIALAVVAWGSEDPRSETVSPTLVPYHLSEYHEQVELIDYDSTSLLYVALMPPGMELGEFREQAEDVAKAQREHEDRQARAS